jgi:hypothetical protein
MSYCYCCIYGQMKETGIYICTHYNHHSEGQADVSGCYDYIYDDCFDEDDEYPKCYLKDICLERNCERFL